MQISQLLNDRGNAVKNQFIVTTDKGCYFKSYDSLIAFLPNDSDQITLTSKWNYSQTTLKHLKTFLGTSLSKQDLQKRIEAGTILLNDDLEIN